MNSSYRLLPRLWQWLRRLPHRKGYGIHSPFAFQLVTGVVYCREAYYAYTPLSQTRVTQRGQLSEQDDQLLFRLANHQMARRVLLVGSEMERPAAYIQAARTEAELVQVERVEDWSKVFDRYDMVVVNCPMEQSLGQVEALARLAVPPSRSALLVLCGIYRSERAQALWKVLKASTAFTLSFDLHRIGLLYMRPELKKQDYIINYF